VESQNEMKITSPPGTRLPLLAGATGKAFLSMLDEKVAREVIRKMGLLRYTSKSVTDSKRFLREVEETKERGYAIDDEEYLLGVRAVAAPIPISSHPPVAIWAVGFTSSLTDEKMGVIIPEVQKTAREISRAVEGLMK
jgi:DNA-binding IclR family transcriptional regulator